MSCCLAMHHDLSTGRRCRRCPSNSHSDHDAFSRALALSTCALLVHFSVLNACHQCLFQASLRGGFLHPKLTMPLRTAAKLCAIHILRSECSRSFFGLGSESHARTVVRECCKGDDESQWERGKFYPPPLKNPLTDGHRNLCR